MASVKQRDGCVLSAGDVVVLYNVKDRTWSISAWCEADLTDAEWLSDDRFVVADVMGVITMDRMQETQFMPVRNAVAWVVYGCYNKRLTLQINLPYEPPVDIPSHQFRSHFGGVYKVRAHPRRARQFASCSVDNTVKVWNTERTSPDRTLDEHFG